MAAKNLGRTFEREIQQSALHLGWLYWKLAVPMSTRTNRTTNSTYLAKLQEPPYDAFLVQPHGGRHVALEFKSLAVRGTFPLKNIKDHQFDALERVDQVGGMAWMVVRLPEPLEAWAIRGQDLVKLRNDLANLPKPRVSIPIGTLTDETKFTKVLRTRVEGKTIWDLRVLVDERT